jgi:hypothetical protein
MSNVMDLRTLLGRVYVGKSNGNACREYFGLDQMQISAQSPLVVKFPNDAKTMTTSFFIAVFGDLVKRAGSHERAHQWLRFEGPYYLAVSEFELHISTVLEFQRHPGLTAIASFFFSRG